MTSPFFVGPMMLIRYGYELSFYCFQPTLMVCLLDSHPEYDHRVRYKSPFITTPMIGTQTYADSFGNLKIVKIFFGF